MTPFHFPGTPAWLGFAHPWAFALLLLLPLIWWLWLRADRRPVLRFSALSSLRDAGGAAARRARLILPVLRTIGLVALTVAVARPQQADESTRVFAEGVAIQLVIDTSRSMEDFDLSPPGRRGDDQLSRLDVVKNVIRRFVTGDEKDGLAGRPNDLIGVIRFARYADSVCPLTLDHENLLKVLQATSFAGEEFVAEARRLQNKPMLSRADEARLEELMRAAAAEGGTAIGAGLALAVERLRDLKRTSGAGDQLVIKSKVVILLTDGENNVDEIVRRYGADPMLVAMPPVQAGELAAKEGIKVYTILAGTGEVQRMGISNRIVGRLPVKDDDLRKIADLTGGKFYRATDLASLEDVYREIDQLERTRTEERRFLRWGELSLPWLVIAFAAISLQLLLDSTRLRKIP